jgi:hypothetical protein
MEKYPGISIQKPPATITAAALMKGVFQPKKPPVFGIAMRKADSQVVEFRLFRQGQMGVGSLFIFVRMLIF